MTLPKALSLMSAVVALQLTLSARPVDLSAPPGGLGPTNAYGSAHRWVELTDIDFGSGLSLPLRMSFLASRDDASQEFGISHWRTPLHDSRLLNKTATEWPLMLPCGKVMTLVPLQTEPGVWATADGEWIARPRGPNTLVSREDGWQLEFNKKGALIRLQDDNKRTLLWTRDASGALQQVAELVAGKPQPAAYIVTRNPASNRITQVTANTAHGSRTWKFSYHTTEQLREITFPEGQTVTAGYSTRPDGMPQMTLIGTDGVPQTLTWNVTTDALISDGVWTYTITPQKGSKPLMSRVGPMGETESTHEDEANHRSISTKANGVTTTRYQVASGPAKGKVERITRRLPGAKEEQVLSQLSYDERGLLVEETNALGHKTTHSYELYGASIHQGIKKHTTTNALGHAYSQQFDIRGNLIAVTDALGQTTRYEYNALGRQIRAIGPDGTVVSSRTYDRAGNITSRTNAAGAKTQFSYSKEGQLISEINPLGHTTRYSNDAKGNRTSKTDALGRVWRYEYDKHSRLLRTVGPDGKEVERRSYDLQGRLVSTMDAAGHVQRTEYDHFGRVIARTDALQRTTRYEFHPASCATCSAGALPTLIISPSGRKTERIYDADSHLISETIAYGTQQAATTRRSYDLAGNLLSITDPLGRVTKQDYDAAGQHIKTTYPDGTSIAMAYDAAGHMTQKTNELSEVTKIAYDGYGNPTSITDPAGHTTRQLYLTPGAAALRRPDATQSPEGRIIRRVYDAAGRTTHQVVGECVAGFQPASDKDIATTVHIFDAVGNEIETTDPVGRKLTHTYDTYNRRITTTDVLKRVWTYSYSTDADATGNPPCCGADPTGNAKALTTLFPDGTKESRIQDAAGQLVQTTDANGHSIQYAYDADGRLTTLTDARGSMTRWGYDLRGKLERKSYPDGSSEAYEHDAAGQLITRTRPDGTAAIHSYSPRGKLLSTTWSRTGDSPEAGGNLPPSGKRKTDTIPTTVLPSPSHFQYDKAGRLIQAKNASADIQRTYTSTGKMSSETQIITIPDSGFLNPDSAASKAAGDNKPTIAQASKAPKSESYQVGYTYTPDGQIDILSYPSGKQVHYRYTARNQLAEVKESRTADSAVLRGDSPLGHQPLATYAYSQDGKVTSISYNNQTKTEKSYDTVGRLHKVAHISPQGKALWSETSRYDDRNRRTARIHEDGKAELFGYDPAGQVIAAAYGQAQGRADSAVTGDDLPLSGERNAGNLPVQGTSQEFTYDEAGNRTAFTDLGGTQTRYETNSANQYTAVDDLQPRYDPNGNLITDDKNNYTWDADIHLLAITSREPKSGTPHQESRFSYDALHRRVTRTEPTGQTTQFIHDGWNVIEERSAQKKPVELHPSSFILHTSLVWGHDVSGRPQGAGGIGGLLQSQSTAHSAYFHYDSNGNVVLLADAKGQETARYSYDAFGKTLTATGPASETNKYRFSTKPFENHGALCYYGYRYYSAELGRWTARDPIGEKGGINLFLTIFNNLVEKTDYLGLSNYSLGGSLDYDTPTLPSWSTPTNQIYPRTFYVFNWLGDCIYACTGKKKALAQTCIYNACSKASGPSDCPSPGDMEESGTINGCLSGNCPPIEITQPLGHYSFCVQESELSIPICTPTVGQSPGN